MLATRGFEPKLPRAMSRSRICRITRTDIVGPTSCRKSIAPLHRLLQKVQRREGNALVQVTQNKELVARLDVEVPPRLSRDHNLPRSLTVTVP